MEEEKVPTYIKNRVDLKASTIHSFSAAIEFLKTPHDNISLGPDTRLILMTNFGMVEGTLQSTMQSDDEKTTGTVISDALIKTRNTFLAEDEETLDTDTISNNFSLITISNAKVTPYSNPAAVSIYEVLNLFTDQIVGFTFGSSGKSTR